MAHSGVSLDGQQHSVDTQMYWVALVKDLDQKGYYIRTVDTEVYTWLLFLLYMLLLCVL